jgi:Pvc16 N-terminal domain
MEDSMIDAAIRCLAGELNEFLGRTLETVEELVTVSNLLGADGAAAPDTGNRIVLFLTAIERDTASQRAPDGAGRMDAGSGPLFLNIYLMAVANFPGRHYPEALRLISLLIGFFHEHRIFDRHSSPGMDPAIDRLILDIENTPPAVMSNVWSVLGGRYLPSVLYRVRMVSIDKGYVQRVPRITEPGMGLSGRPA